MKFNKVCVALFVSTLGFVSINSANALELKAGHSHIENEATDLSLKEFGKKLEELSKGDIKVTVYANSQLGSEREMAEQVINGALDISMCGGQQIENFYNLFAVTNIPFLFRDYDHVKKFIKSDIAYDYLLDAALENNAGFLGLWFETCGPRSFYAKKEINSPNDLKGLKMRVPESPMSIATVQLMGGQPTPLSSSEVYSALQQSVIDGAENNFEFYVQSRHFEVAPYYCQDMHSMPPNVMIMSQYTYENLTKEQQKWVREAAIYARDFQMQYYDKTLDELYEKADELGIKLNYVNNKPFAEKTSSLIDEEMKNEQRAKLIKDIQDIQ